MGALLLIVFLVLILVVKWSATFKARRANAALAKGLLNQRRRRPSAAEVAQLGQRFEQALGLLRKLRFGSKNPRSGRGYAHSARSNTSTTSVVRLHRRTGFRQDHGARQPGLRFPLADRLGREAVRGVGGTRNCDWWFTDEAIFVDTAGRYTTQEANRDADAGAWKGFLQLLKKARPRRPINGLLVTISVGDLLQQSAAEREAQAQAVRTRVQELYHDLGVRFPIYVLVTKRSPPGFGEFFADLGRDARGSGVIRCRFAFRLSTPPRCRRSSSDWNVGCTSSYRNGSRKSATRLGARSCIASPSSLRCCGNVSSRSSTRPSRPRGSRRGSAPGSLFHQRHAGRKPSIARWARSRESWARAQASAPQRPSGRVTS